MQITAYTHRVNPFLLVHDNHYVVGRLIIDQQMPFAVSYRSTGRVLHSVVECITVCLDTKILTEKLKKKETNDIDEYDDNSYTSNDPLPSFCIKVSFF